MKNTFISILMFLLMFSIIGFYLAIRPFRIISSYTPKTFGVAYEKIAFRTKDKITLRGWFIPNINPHAKTIILMHGYPADKGNILPGTIFLHQSYNLLYFDFRYLGESGGHFSTVGKNEVLDLLAAKQHGEHVENYSSIVESFFYKHL
jgi:pimeloyl-ACP methyl ester carboxylesterase